VRLFPMTPVQSRGLLVGAAGLLCLISWKAGYQPALQLNQREVRHIKELRHHLTDVETIVSSAGGISAWLHLNGQRLARFRERVPQEAQLPQLLNRLVEQLKMSDLRVRNVTQGNLEPVQDGGTPLLIDGLPCVRLPLTITAEGRYLVLLRMMEQLTSESFPAVVSLQQVTLQRKQESNAVLDIVLNLSLYLVKPPSDG